MSNGSICLLIPSFLFNVAIIGLSINVFASLIG